MHGAYKKLQGNAGVLSAARSGPPMPVSLGLPLQHTTWRIMVLVFLLSWLSQIPYLFPIPDLEKAGSSDVIEATKATGWTISAALVVFGLVASFAGMAHRPALKQVG